MSLGAAIRARFSPRDAEWRAAAVARRLEVVQEKLQFKANRLDVLRPTFEAIAAYLADPSIWQPELDLEAGIYTHHVNALLPSELTRTLDLRDDHDLVRAGACRFVEYCDGQLLHDFLRSLGIGGYAKPNPRGQVYVHVRLS